MITRRQLANADTGTTASNEDVAGQSIASDLSSSVPQLPAEKSQPDWLQQMYDLEAIGWNGGENFWEGNCPLT